MAGYLGLSIGARNLVAAQADGSATAHRAVLTLSPHRPPELGVPADNQRRGVIISGFVERVGDPVPIVASDRSAHSGAWLVAQAVAALIRTTGPGLPRAIGVAVPAHWRGGDVDALRRHLPGLRMVSDAAAALTALQLHPGLPARGVVVLCDLGATGTSITLADAGAGFRPLGDTVRVDDFSGELVDQAVLRHVLAGMEVDPSATSAVAALAQLRERCRAAKERLSLETATAVNGIRSTVRVTRSELEELLRDPVDRLISTLEDMLHRNNIHRRDVVAIATVGGGARIPYVTQRLSSALRTPVVTTPRAQHVSAAGAGLIAQRGLEDLAETALSPGAAFTLAAPVVGSASTMAAAAVSLTPTMAGAAVSLAWSADDSSPEVAEFVDDSADVAAPADGCGARPQLLFREPEESVEPVRWYHRPGALFAAAACLAVLAAAGLVLSSGEDPVGTAPAGSTGADVSVTPAPLGAPAPVEASAPAEAPIPQEAPMLLEAPVPREVTAPPASRPGPAPATETVVLTRSPGAARPQAPPPPPPTGGALPVIVLAPVLPSGGGQIPQPGTGTPGGPPNPGGTAGVGGGAESPGGPVTGEGAGAGPGAGSGGSAGSADGSGGGEASGGGAGSGEASGGGAGTGEETGTAGAGSETGGDTGTGGGAGTGGGTGSGEGSGTGQGTGTGEDTGSGGGTGAGQAAGTNGGSPAGGAGAGEGAGSGGDSATGQNSDGEAGAGQGSGSGVGEEPSGGGAGGTCETVGCP